MSADAEDEARAIARTLRLRGPVPTAVRLSRRAVLLTAGVAAAGLAAVAGWSLSERRPPSVGTPPPVADSPRPAEQLAALPKDYAALPRDVPPLGPPVIVPPPRPGLASEAPASSAPSPATAPLFVAGTAIPAPQAPPEGPGPTAAAPEPPDVPPKGPVLLAGTSIRAALVTGVRSDLPGPVAAQVTENVYDSATGAILLIPQGSRLLGVHDRQPAFGENRVRLVWDRLILPDGKAVGLAEAPATDPSGYAGLPARVDRRWGQVLGASLISFALSAGAVLGQQTADDELLRALRTGGSDVASDVGARVVARGLEVGPRLTVRPGAPVRVLLARDLVLPPWAGG